MGKLRIALVMSVLANVFLLSMFIGGTAWLEARRPMIAAGSLRIAGAELPDTERRAFRAALRDTRASMRPTAFAGQQARTEAAALLRQPVLDQAALAAALDRLRTADITMRTAIEQRAIAFAATLSAADREQLAVAMEKRAERGNRRAKR